MKVLTVAQVLRRQPLNRQFHRIHGIAAAGQHRHLHQGMPGFVEVLPGAPGVEIRPGEQPLHGHAVVREGAGLVDGEHRGTAQALHRRGPAGQHTEARQAQRPERQEQGQHHRNLIGQQGQGQGQACQQGPRPVTADHPLQHHEAGTHRHGQQGEPCREPAGAPLQPGRGCLHRAQAVTQPSQLGFLRHRCHRRPAPPRRHQGTGQDQLPRSLARHRKRLAREQRFIEPEAHPLQQPGIGGDPIALLQAQPITEAHLIGAQVQVHVASAHPSPGSGEAGQLRQGAVTPVALQTVQHHDGQHEHQQHRPIRRLSDQRVDQGTGQQQQVGGFQQGHRSRACSPSPSALWGPPASSQRQGSRMLSMRRVWGGVGFGPGPGYPLRPCNPG